MRKRVAFRALIILVASALLLTSTGAYNILVFADQNMELSSLSATDEDEASVPSVATYGGELITEAAEMEALELATQSGESNIWGEYADPLGGDPIPADGSADYPYKVTKNNILDVQAKIANPTFDQNNHAINPRLR